MVDIGVKAERTRTDAAVDRDGVAAVIGLGYVGLPTALDLHRVGRHVIGIDIDPIRIGRIREGRVDGSTVDLTELSDRLGDSRFELSADPDSIARAQEVVICVPTPVDGASTPDLRPLRAACDSVVDAAGPGQTIILTSTTFIGCTRRFLIEPLRDRGLEVGVDLHVAFSPERLDPGNSNGFGRDVPRVLGGATPQCSIEAARVIGPISARLHEVSSPEAAEMAKLVENTYRAVNIALANEFADAAAAFGVDIKETLDAAASKPYGFMSFRPGPGVGGHCIPCDPHYLLWGMRSRRCAAPVIDHAMGSLSRRPKKVVDRVVELLGESAKSVRGARVVLVGLAYKPGVQDVRESPALTVAAELRRRGAHVEAVDDHVRGLVTDELGEPIEVLDGIQPSQVDCVVIMTTHPGSDHSWVKSAPLVLDTTYSLEGELGSVTL